MIEYETINRLLDQDDAGNVEHLLKSEFVNLATSAKRVQSSHSSTEEPQRTTKTNKENKINNSEFIDLLKQRAEDLHSLAKVIEQKTTQQGIAPEEDDIDLFMKSMSLTIKRFTPVVQSEAKRKIFNIVNELEDRHHV